MELGNRRTLPKSAGPSKAQFCIICLDTSEACKLYPANAYNLDVEYKHLTGISLQREMLFLPQFCVECAQRMSNCTKLRNRSLRSYYLLLGLVKIKKSLTMQNIETLKTSNNLTASIAKRSFQPDHCDLYLIHKQQPEILEESPKNNNNPINMEELNPTSITNNECKIENDENEVVEEESVTEAMDFDIDFCNDENEVAEEKSVTDEVDYFCNSEYLTDDTDDNLTNSDIECDKEIKDGKARQVEDYNFMNVARNEIDNIDCDGFETSDSESVAVNNKAVTRNVETANIFKETNESVLKKQTRKRQYVRTKTFCTDENEVAEEESLMEEIDFDIDFCNEDLDIDDNIRNSGIECNKESKDDKTRQDVDPNCMNVARNEIHIDCDGFDSDSESVAVNKAITRNVETAKKFSETNESMLKRYVERKRRKYVRKKTSNNSKSLEYLKHYKITELTYKEQIADIQKRKENANFKNSPYKCMLCFKGFLNEDTYKSHMERHTDQYGKFECPACKIHFKSAFVLMSHYTTCHSQRYSCLNCPLVTNYSMTAKKHAASHKGLVYQCPHCPQKYRSESGYLSHLRIWHPSDVVCPLCGFSFLNRNGLRYHIAMKHRGQCVQDLAGPSCEPCNVRFASAAAYDQHLEISPRHNDGKCRQRNGPKQRNESREKRCITCKECGEQFEGPASYSCHVWTWHPGMTCGQTATRHRSRLCEHCGKSFKTYYTLRDHIKQHSGEPQLQCDVCKKKFFTRNVLILHMKTHRANKPVYKCSVCKIHCSNKFNLKRHMWTHEAEKPHKCDACSKTFVTPSVLRTHVEHAHHKKPYPKRRRGDKMRASRGKQRTAEMRDA